MAQMPAVCKTCTVPVKSQFDPTTGARGTVTINSMLLVTDQCFVYDTIEFLDGGQIVFAPRERDTYYDNYNVICRKLYIQGGSAPKELNPCRPTDPGKTYDGNNVITWLGRLQTAADGQNYPTPAADGASFESNQWSDQGQGNDGKSGGRGGDGATGQNGGRGQRTLNLENREQRPVLNIVALEVEFANPVSHLTIDWNGQVGGDGGDGQEGGRGGNGMGGRDGSTNDSVWGDSCERPPGNGGNAGDGGNGGPGGNGGHGGDAGDIYVISSAANIAAGGIFKSGQFSYINGGGKGGSPGNGARGGRAGVRVGNRGKKTSACEEAHDGQAGNPGVPDPLGSGSTVKGSAGTAGAPGQLGFEAIDPPTSETCADLIPIALTLSSVSPNTGTRGSTVTVTLTGTGFNPAAALHTVNVSGLGVSASTPVVASGTSMSCDLTLTAAAPQGARDVTVTFGPAPLVTATLSGGFSVLP